MFSITKFTQIKKIAKTVDVAINHITAFLEDYADIWRETDVELTVEK